MRTERYESPVITASGGATVRELAAKMEDHGLGSVVILDESQRPVGILTDRDLTVRVVAEGLDPDATRAAEVMSKPLLAATPDEPLETLVGRMAAAGVRRLPVVRDDRLVGIVAVDDLLLWLGRELDDLGEAARREITTSWEQARKRRRHRTLEERVQDLSEVAGRASERAQEFVGRELETLRDRLTRLLGVDAGRGD